MPLEAIGTMMRRAVEGVMRSATSRAGTLNRCRGSRRGRADAFADHHRLQWRLPERPHPAGQNALPVCGAGDGGGRSSSVPCGLIFNECPRDDWVAGRLPPASIWSCPPIPMHPLPNSSRRVAELDASRPLAGGRGRGRNRRASVRRVRAKSWRIDDRPGQAAAAFVDATGVDLLAVSVGNVHIRTEGRTGLDLVACGDSPARFGPAGTSWRFGIAASASPERSSWAWPRSTSGLT